MRRLWSDTMVARVFGLLLVGIVAAALLAFWVSNLQMRANEAMERNLRLTDRIAEAASILSTAPADARPQRLGVGPEALRSATSERVTAPVDPQVSAWATSRLGDSARVEVSQPTDQDCALIGPADGPAPPPPTDPVVPRPPPPPGPSAPPPSRNRPFAPGPPGRGRTPVVDRLFGAAWPAPRPPPAPPTCRWVRLRFANGGDALLIAPSGPRPPTPTPPFGPGSLLVVAVVAGALAWLTARLTVAPLTQLADAAHALGEDLQREPLKLGGPREVRRAAAAFNAMQTRLRRGLEDRTHMLAAISHDLQTPLTRLRLRLEKVDDPELREQLMGDQAAMQTLVREGLDLARASHDGEDAACLDVDALLESLADDAVAAGQAVQVVGGCGCTVRTHPHAIRRIVSNLLENAVKYSGAAELTADLARGAVTLRVLDRGPGLSEDELVSMFEPFRRGEASRSRETGGAGLGLAIARLLAERCGARLELRNRRGGGLEAHVTLQGAERTPTA